MITDMERIGDQTADIAEIVISANTEESVDIDVYKRQPLESYLIW